MKSGCGIKKVCLIFSVLSLLFAVHSIAFAYTNDWTAYTWIWQTSYSGGGETYDQSDWVIQNGICRQNDMYTHEFMYITGDESWSDYILTAKIKMDDVPYDGPFAGVVFRAQEGGPYYTAYLAGYYDKIQTARYPGIVGSLIYHNSGSTPIDPNIWYELKVRVQGSNVQVYLNNVSMMNFNDPGMPSSGKIGLFTYSTSTSFDDVVVTDLSGNELFRDDFERDYIARGRIVNIGSGQCFKADNINNSIVTMADCDNTQSQLFTYRSDNTIRVFESLCLAASVVDLRWLMITVNNCNGEDSQKWALDLNGQLKSLVGGCSEVLESKGIKLSSCNTPRQSQLFKFIPQGATVAQCFGAVGPNCEGVYPLAKAGPRTPDGTQRMYVSVGSIAHDNCCLRHPDGVSCGEWEPLEDWDVPCKAEWEKAWRNTNEKRQWQVFFGIEPYAPPYSLTHYSDDLTLAVEPNRHLGLPTQNGQRSNSKDDIVYELEEAVSTRRFSAPSGTKLDWYDVDFCASGQADQKERCSGPYKDPCIICR